MKTIKVYIVRESDGSYSSYMDEKADLPYGLIGEGSTVAEAINEWRRAYNDMRSLFEEEGREFEEVEFIFHVKVNIIFETAKDGGCSCHMVEELPDFGLLGYGNTPQEAKADMLQAYEEIKELLRKEGKEVPELEFVYH